MSAPNRISSVLNRALASRAMQYAFVAFNIAAQLFLWWSLYTDLTVGKWGMGIWGIFSLGPLFVAAGLYNHLPLVVAQWTRNETAPQQKLLVHLVLLAMLVSLGGNLFDLWIMWRVGVPWQWPDWVIVGAAAVSLPPILAIYARRLGGKLPRAVYISVAIGMATSVVAQLVDGLLATWLHKAPMQPLTLFAVAVIVAGFLANFWRLLRSEKEEQKRANLLANQLLFRWRAAATIALGFALGYFLLRV